VVPIWTAFIIGGENKRMEAYPYGLVATNGYAWRDYVCGVSIFSGISSFGAWELIAALYVNRANRWDGTPSVHR
jgi:hypothetical protein